MAHLSWDDLQFFLAVVRERQLSRAGRVLGTSHVTVARRIDRLEQALNTRLFERNPRGYEPTPASLRLIETAATPDGRMQPWTGPTDIFIYPGYRFRVTDALMTNFHLPKSTLLMLVAALMGQDRMRAAYAERHAVTTLALHRHGLDAGQAGVAGGSSFWLAVPRGVDSDTLTMELKTEGVLIEPGRPFFRNQNAGAGFYRLSYSSIDAARIDQGIERIADACQRLQG